MHKFASFLEKRLKQKLPGTDAQLKMAPVQAANNSPRKMQPFNDARQSSVLVMLFPNNAGNLELTLTLRTDDIDHGGQISFAGGRAEGGETAIETALREAEEETGINPEEVTIVGNLSELYLNHSNNRVVPIVGFLPNRPKFSINQVEVEELFTIELDSLLNKKNIIKENWDLSNRTYRVPYWDIHRVPLWGATAMILSELLELYREFLNQ